MLNLPKSFELYLKSQGASPLTIKNYISDFNHFWGWFLLILKSRAKPGSRFIVYEEKTHQLVNQITPQLINDYKNFLVVNKIPIRTINRRLSTLRKFGKFCISQAWLKSNPAKKVKNATLNEKKQKTESERILKKYEESLKKEKTSLVTIKNYLSDLRHFLGFIEAT